MATVLADYATLLGDAALWANLPPNYLALAGVIGDAATNWADTQVAIANITQHTPTILAFVLDNNLDYIYVGHTPTVYPADPTEAMPFDNHMGILVGRTDAIVTPVVLPPAATFKCTGRSNLVTSPWSQEQLDMPRALQSYVSVPMVVGLQARTSSGPVMSCFSLLP